MKLFKKITLLVFCVLLIISTGCSTPITDSTEVENGLFLKNNYKVINTDDTSVVELIKEEISSEDYLELVVDPIDLSCVDWRMFGELISRSKLFVIFSEGMQFRFYDNPGRIWYYRLPYQLSDNLGFVKITRERSVVLDRDNGLVVVLGYEYANTYLEDLKDINIINSIKFNNPNALKDVKVIGGVQENNSTKMVILKPDNSVEVVDMNTLGLEKSLSASEWKSIGVIQEEYDNNEFICVIQVNKTQTKIREIDLKSETVIYSNKMIKRLFKVILLVYLIMGVIS